MTKKLIITVLVIFLSSFVFAASNNEPNCGVNTPAQAPHDFYGTVKNSSNAALSGENLVNATLSGYSFVKFTDANGQYGTGVNGTYLHVWNCQGDNTAIKFYVQGVNVQNYTYAAGATTLLNLTTQAAQAICGDGTCNGNEVCGSVNDYPICNKDCGACAAASTPTGGGGGGGTSAGGGGAAAVSESQTILTITAGSTGKAAFTKWKNFGIMAIIIKSKINAANIIITVKEASKPSGADDAISALIGGVYKYMSIIESVLGDENIDSVTIQFMVEKSWLNKGYNEDSVKLLRYKGDKWAELKTTKIKSDSTYVYYEAESHGLTTFAITAEKSITAFDIIDIIKEFYQGTGSYTAFEIIDIIKNFYGG